MTSNHNLNIRSEQIRIALKLFECHLVNSMFLNVCYIVDNSIYICFWRLHSLNRYPGLVRGVLNSVASLLPTFYLLFQYSLTRYLTFWLGYRQETPRRHRGDTEETPRNRPIEELYNIHRRLDIILRLNPSKTRSVMFVLLRKQF